MRRPRRAHPFVALPSGRGEAENYDIKAKVRAADPWLLRRLGDRLSTGTVADAMPQNGSRPGTERAKGDATWDRRLCGLRPWEEMAPARWRASNSRGASRRLAAVSF